MALLDASTAPHIPSAMPLPNYVSSLYGAPAFHTECLYIAVNGTSAVKASPLCSVVLSRVHNNTRCGCSLSLKLQDNMFHPDPSTSANIRWNCPSFINHEMFSLSLDWSKASLRVSILPAPRVPLYYHGCLPSHCPDLFISAL